MGKGRRELEEALDGDTLDRKELKEIEVPQEDEDLQGFVPVTAIITPRAHAQQG